MAAKMEDSLGKVCQYLKDRGVDQDVIRTFESEKMDIYAVLNATEKILEGLGLRKAGDRLSLQAFCKRETDSCGQEAELSATDRKKRLLQSFLSTKNKKRAAPALDTSNKKKDEMKTKKVQLGWKHLKGDGEAYTMIPLSKGGGSRTVDIPVTTTRSELMCMCKNLFFPNGNSVFGNVDDMVVDLTNFKDEKIDDHIAVGESMLPFNINNYMEAHKFKTVRLHLSPRKLLY